MVKIDGACFCGDVTWRAAIDPGGVALCHCTQCQINGASAYQWVVMMPAEDLELMSGKLKAYVKIAESGNKLALSCSPLEGLGW